MISYNDQSIIAGFIKELLHSFNLPTFKVAKKDHFLNENDFYLYNNKIRRPKTFIKDGPITDESFREDFSYKYNYNRPIPNLVKNLEIRNNTYDSYTHNYLGNYLRFIRDYKNINLMQLYNCFSNEMPNYLDIKGTSLKSVPFEFNSEDKSYKIYMVPVKLFEKYSIYIDSDFGVEVTCGFYDKTQYNPFASSTIDNMGAFYNSTYMRKKQASFSTAIEFNSLLKDNLTNLEDSVLKTLMDNEGALKLFIKIPFSNNSSIVVLESTNSVSNNWVLDSSHSIVWNTSVVNCEDKDKDDIPLVSKSQLLTINSGVSHPFSDRLIEYLVDNVITSDDDISDNIKRIQQKLFRRHRENKNKVGIEYIDKDGIWNSSYKNILYEVAKQEKLTDRTYDILGYVDKDVEQVLGEDIDIYNFSETKSKYDKERGK